MDYLRRLIQRKRETKSGSIIYSFTHAVYDIILSLESVALYCIVRPFPLKKQIVASTFYGIKYGDNPQFIFEQLHQDYPEFKLIWIQDKKCAYKVPEYVYAYKCSMGLNIFKRFLVYYTSKVWIDTHHIDRSLIKRKGQLFIETWHGGLGIKKIEGDVERYKSNRFQMEKIKSTCKKADVFISNSNHLDEIYRNAFGYTGYIWKCGYPKNDRLVCPKDNVKEKISFLFNIPTDSKIVLYAPTFRSAAEIGDTVDEEPYKIDVARLTKKLNEKYGGNWFFAVHWHPFMIKTMKTKHVFKEETVIDVTLYPDIQELLMACDIFISDYSSCIFDAALAKKPCFIYATDYDVYIDERGLYYNFNDLPFPVAMNNQELIENILSFSDSEYIYKWETFKKITGLYETGHASKDIAQFIGDFMQS